MPARRGQGTAYDRLGPRAMTFGIRQFQSLGVPSMRADASHKRHARSPQFTLVAGGACLSHTQERSFASGVTRQDSFFAGHFGRR